MDGLLQQNCEPPLHLWESRSKVEPPRTDEQSLIRVVFTWALTVAPKVSIRAKAAKLIFAFFINSGCFCNFKKQ